MKLFLIRLLPLLFLGYLHEHATKPKVLGYIAVTKDNSDKISSDVAFTKMMDVLTHQRCLNCHPNDDIPKQGEESHPHFFGMARGAENLGFEATQCSTCHQSTNNLYSGVPGAPHWSLAPASMRWEGLTRIQIAESFMDPKRNGGKSPEELLHHLTEDKLVLWAWEPGVDANGNYRETPPIPKNEYIEAVQEWFKKGHVIPSR